MISETKKEKKIPTVTVKKNTLVKKLNGMN
jgi:hypothetical protein